MPSDWPHVFFPERATINLPAAVPAAPAVAQRQVPLPVQTSAPVSNKWPDLFYNQRSTTPEAPAPSLAPAAVAAPPAQKPFQTARIPVPAKQELPTITLPKRIPVTGPAAPRGPLPAPGPLSAPAATPAKAPALKLTNGENVTGTILAESPEAIFLQHEILGVITVPKNAIASRFVEILLHNGDTVAGECIVDTAQFVLVKSPILGTLTVPRQAIRSIG